jgi:hypothetical protein
MLRPIKKFLRPIGVIGALVLGGAIYHFFGDSIKTFLKEKLGIGK